MLQAPVPRPAVDESLAAADYDRLTNRLSKSACGQQAAMAKLLKTICFLLLAGCTVWPAAAWARHAAILIDAESGTVLQAVEPTSRWYPASLTKMMTVYLAFEAIEAHRLDLDEQLAISMHAASQSPTELGLGAGEKIGTEQAILAVILQSANDAAVVLAERIAGSEPAFAAAMTVRARELGMTRTEFRNASGLPDTQQVTTARDMAVLGQALLHNYPQYFHFFAATSFTYDGQTFGTINGILSRYSGADGIKTGFTCGSGYNLVASATRDGRRLIGVVLGGQSSEERHSEMSRLLDAGFAMERTSPGTGLQLADLAGVVPRIDAPPPMQLSSAECAYGVGTSETAPGLSGSGRLSGWGVIFGSFPKRAQAQKALSTARGSLKSVVGAGRATIVGRKWEGMQRYSALIVGLSKEQAGKACKHMWTKFQYCLVLSPAVLNNRNAVWR